MSEQTTSGQPASAAANVRLTYAFAKERGLIVLDAAARPAVIGARGRPDPFIQRVERDADRVGTDDRDLSGGGFVATAA